jgi:hypothetical protein
MPNREHAGFNTHILRNTHHYGKAEDIMERIDYSRKGQIMNIKENFYIYIHKHNNTLIDEQKTDENNHSSTLFDTPIQYTDTNPQNHPHSCKYKTLINLHYQETSIHHNTLHTTPQPCNTQDTHRTNTIQEWQIINH